jgi:hypothetical protein
MQEGRDQGASNVSADTAEAGPRPNYMILPPVEYDHYYEGDLTIRVVPTLEELLARCNITNPITLACAMVYEKNCVIYLLPDETMRKRGWTTGLLLRHEIGHWNGWPGDHPGERPLPWPSPIGSIHMSGEDIERSVQDRLDAFGTRVPNVHPTGLA